jgi:hypothetical protein
MKFTQNDINILKKIQSDWGKNKIIYDDAIIKLRSYFNLDYVESKTYQRNVTLLNIVVRDMLYLNHPDNDFHRGYEAEYELYFNGCL